MRIAAVLVLVLLPPAGQTAGQDVAAEVGDLRRAGRYREAWERTAAVSDPVARQRSRLDVLYWGGDLRGALREGRRGLELASDDAWLLHQCSRLAQDLGARDLLAEYAPRLRRAAASLRGESRSGSERSPS